MNVKVNGIMMQVELYKNRSAEAVKELLKKGPLTISMQDHAHTGKSGSLGVNLPMNNAPVTPEARISIFPEGQLLVHRYGPCIWDYTRLGRVKNLSRAEIKNILGKGNVTATLAL